MLLYHAPRSNSLDAVWSQFTELPMDYEPTFEIFRVSSERDAELVESVCGLLSALHRMEEIAAGQPGRYFLFECRSRSTLMKIDSRKSLLGRPDK